MKESKHTKGKLEINEDCLGLAQINGKTVFVAMPTACQSAKDILILRANSERLLACWNSHDALVEACEAVKQCLEIMDNEQGTIVNGCVFLQLRAALELAGEGE